MLPCSRSRALLIITIFSCGWTCSERCEANVSATSSLSAFLFGSQFPSGVGYSYNNTYETFGGASGSGNHSELWFPANAPIPNPGVAGIGFSVADARAQSLDPLGESHANSFAITNQLKFVNASAAVVNINLVVEWIYDVTVTIGDSAFDTGDAGFFFRVRNVTTSTTLLQRDLNIASGHEDADYGRQLMVALPAQSTTLIQIDGQVWADAYTVPAPSAGFALIVHAIGFRARRRSR